MYKPFGGSCEIVLMYLNVAGIDFWIKYILGAGDKEMFYAGLLCDITLIRVMRLP